MEVTENGFRKSKLFQMMKRIGSRKEKEKQERRRYGVVWGGADDLRYIGWRLIGIEMEDTILTVEEEISKEVQSIGQGRRPAR